MNGARLLRHKSQRKFAIAECTAAKMNKFALEHRSTWWQM